MTLQGLKFKTLFFAALFAICLLRAICLMSMTFKYSELNKTNLDDNSLNLAIRLLLDLPTLVLISVFSAFSYYLSRLNQEVETILH